MPMPSGLRVSRVAALGAFLSCCLPLGAFAAESRGVIEEVIVTAQRTEQSLQDVPIAVTAFSGEMLEEKQIISPSDLQMNAPNVSYTNVNFGGSSFSIRGIGRLVVSSSGEAGVSIHQNEIPVALNLPATEFYDLERVEVLRGPQGTLFGRNATGGVVNLVTRKPDFGEWNGYIDGEYGDYDHMRVKGAINVPIGESFALRAAGISLDRDGYIDNTAFGQVGNCLDASTAAPTDRVPCQLEGIDDDIDGRDLYAYRITGSWLMTDRASLWVQYQAYWEDDDRVRITNQVCERNDLPVQGCLPNGFAFETPHAGSTTGGIFGGLNGAVTLGDPTPVSAFPRGDDVGFRKMHTDFEPIYEYDSDQWTFNFNYDLDNFSLGLQGGWTQTEYLSRQDYNMNVGFDLFPTPQNPDGLWPTSAPAGGAGDDWTSSQCNFQDGTAGIFGGCVHPYADPTRVFAYDQGDSESEGWSIEAKVQSDFAGPFNFILGVNHLDSESFGDYYVVANTLDLVGLFGVPGLGFPPLYPTMFDATGDPSGSTFGESTSVFGEVYFDVTDTVKVTAGLRYNDDQKEVADTGVLFNALNLNALLSGLIGVPDILGPDRVWMRSDLSPYIGAALAGAPIGAGAQQIAEFYGAHDDFLSTLGTAGPFAALTGLAAAVPLVPDFNEARILTGSPSEASWTEITGRLGFDWQVTPSTMVYAFYSRGYKPGGFNPPLNQSFIAATNAEFTFDNEQVDAFEIGAKNTLLNGGLVLNGALFVYDYQGLQVTRIANNTSLNDNIDADIWGGELETVWRPAALPALQFDAAYSYLNTSVAGATSVDPLDRTAGDPAFITLENIDPGSLTGVNYVAQADQITPALIQAAYAACAALSDQNVGNGCPPVAPGALYPSGIPAYFSQSFLAANGVTTSPGFPTDLDGNQLPNSPEHTIHLGVAYTFQLGFGTLTPRWDYYWQDDSFAREFNTIGDQIDSWDQHNASLIFQSNDGKWTAKAWARNLQDEDNVTGKYLTSDTSGFYRNYFLTEPRIYGLSLRYSFNGG